MVHIRPQASVPPRKAHDVGRGLRLTPGILSLASLKKEGSFPKRRGVVVSVLLTPLGEGAPANESLCLLRNRSFPP